MNKRGFTLVELLVYVLIAGILSGALIHLVFQLSDVVMKARTKTEVLSNGRLIMDRIMAEVRAAQSVYTPTSDLANNIGRLSLATTIGVPQGETRTYTDFYIVNGQLYMKREGTGAQAINSPRVAITKLKFSRVNVSSTSEGVSIELALRENPRAPRASGQIDFALQSTAAIRNNK